MCRISLAVVHIFGVDQVRDNTIFLPHSPHT